MEGRRAPRTRRARIVLVAMTAGLITTGCRSEESRTAQDAPVARSTQAVRVALPSWPVPRALPGSEPWPEDLRAKLATALALRDPGERPRTRHTRPDGSPRYTNRLVLEPSPYLRQHAYNPVDWRPWGDEAFAEARRLGRPVFLSVGYSTCHWCHVMERESFEDPEIATVLNSKFVPIKVDREERPDVDAVYMTVVQMLTGGGGWPMTVVLTPDAEPFFGGTYFPAREGDRGNLSGLLEILNTLAARYAEDPEGVAEHASSITRALEAASRPRPAAAVPDASPIRETQSLLARTHDEEWGGFGSPPKFPRTVAIELLLRHARRTGDPASEAMALGTLDAMAAGGIRDHVGGGFHRYATDRKWLVPHFEKMLYDNALLAVAYLEAYQWSGEQRFAEVARETLDYLSREMTAPDGGFFSATDADSLGADGEEGEGFFFTWTPAEIDAAVGEERGRLVALRYGVTPEGNFEGRNVLHAARSIEDVARLAGLDAATAEAEIAAARRALYEARAARSAPLRDEKRIAGWNGLAISAFARGARVLRDPALAAAAASAAKLVVDEMVDDDGRLARSYVDGRARHDAVLDDYAFVVAGLLDLYEATFDDRWLRDAIALQKDLDERFRDDVNGGYFLTPKDGEALLVRRKDAYDGALPSGNSAAASNLLRLYELTTDDAYRERAEEILAAFATDLRTQPGASPRLLSALDFLLDSPKEILLVQPTDDPTALDPFLDALAGRFLPAAVVAATTAADLAGASERIPLFTGKEARDGRVTAYVCENRVCALPTTDPAVFAEQIATVRPYPGGGD